jgi:hypothetical protein
MSTQHLTTEKAYFKTFVVNSANTWERKTCTFPAITNSISTVDSTGTAQGIRFHWILDAATGSDAVDTFVNYTTNFKYPSGVSGSGFANTLNATFELGGVQIEAGTVATDLEHKTFAQELALCQRYYYEHANGNNAQSNNRAAICSGAMYNSSSFFGVIQFPFKMRTRPTLVKTSGTDYYRVYGGNVSDGCNDVATQNWSDQAFVINLYDGLSGTQGNGAWAETNNASALIAFSAEL